MDNPLQNLRDIHLPSHISFWPPAPGWFLIAFIILALAASSLFIYYSYKKKNARKTQALLQLHALERRWQTCKNPKLIIEELSTLLRRAALAKYPRQNVAGLHGNLWLAFLDQSGETNEFREGAGRQLISAPYRKSHYGNLNKLFELIKEWMIKAL